MSNVYVGSARIDERGKAYGGKAGDQTGKEVSKQKFYVHKKGWRVFRAKDRAAALKIAADMEAACKNSHIGYDQWQRNTLYKAAEPLGFDCARVKTNCETDCSALVRVCCAYAGIMGLPSDFRTGNMPANLLKTGAFVELKGAKYTDQSAYLGKGDILVTKTHGHTVVVLDDGVKYEGTVEAREYALGERLLKHGAEGADVKQLQQYLIQLGYDLGKWGADGEGVSGRSQAWHGWPVRPQEPCGHAGGAGSGRAGGGASLCGHRGRQLLRAHRAQHRRQNPRRCPSGRRAPLRRRDGRQRLAAGSI